MTKYLITYKSGFAQGQVIIEANTLSEAEAKFHRRMQLTSRDATILSVEEQ